MDPTFPIWHISNIDRLYINGNRTTLVVSYNHEEDHLVFKFACVLYMATMRSMAFLGQWEKVNMIDCEVIHEEMQRQLSSATKHVREAFSSPRGDVCFEYMLPPILADRYIQGYIYWAHCNT